MTGTRRGRTVTSVDVAVTSEPEEVAVTGLEENLWDMWAAFGRGEGCILVDTPQVLRFETPIVHAPYNAVMRSRLVGDVDAQIDEVIAAYAARGVPLMWVLHPTAAPSDLDARLEASGLVESDVCPGMVAPIERLPAPEPPPRGVQIEQLGPAARGDFVELVAWRYSLPDEATGPLLSIMAARGFGEPDCPTKAWVARIDGRVMSKVVLHLAAGVAGLYGVATRAEARGLGLARSLTTIAFDEARRLGYETAVLHSTPMAVGLYAGLGFRHVADFRLFATPGTLHI